MIFNLTFMRNKFLLIANLFSILSIIWTIIINYKLAIAYRSISLKGQLLFGIYEYLNNHVKYYPAGLSFISAILIIFSIAKNKFSDNLFYSIILSGFSIVLLFIRIWTVLV